MSRISISHSRKTVFSKLVFKLAFFALLTGFGTMSFFPIRQNAKITQQGQGQQTRPSLPFNYCQLNTSVIYNDLEITRYDVQSA